MIDSEAVTQEFEAESERVCAGCGHRESLDDEGFCMQATTLPDGDVIRCSRQCTFGEFAWLNFPPKEHVQHENR